MGATGGHSSEPGCLSPNPTPPGFVCVPRASEPASCDLSEERGPDSFSPGGRRAPAVRPCGQHPAQGEPHTRRASLRRAVRGRGLGREPGVPRALHMKQRPLPCGRGNREKAPWRPRGDLAGVGADCPGLAVTSPSGLGLELLWMPHGHLSGLAGVNRGPVGFQGKGWKATGWEATAKGKIRSQQLRAASWPPGAQFISLESEHAWGSLSAQRFKSKHRGKPAKIAFAT